MVVVVVAVVERKWQKVGSMRVVRLLDPLETVLIQLAKNMVEMSVVHQHCPHSHHEKFETLQVATAATVAVVVMVVKEVVDVSQEANLVLYVHFLQSHA